MQTTQKNKNYPQGFYSFTIHFFAFNFYLPIANCNFNNYVSQNKQFIIPWRKKYYKFFYSLLLSFLSSTECVLKHNNQAAAPKSHGFKTNEALKEGWIKSI